MPRAAAPTHTSGLNRSAVGTVPTPSRSHGPAHFQRLYDASPDPWGYRTSAYEAEKYDRTIAALNGRHFQAGFEAGCSIGVLTRRLAAHCRSLLAVDFVEAPLSAAHRACADLPWVRFARLDVAIAWPDGRFDLIVLSEVLYFLSPDAIAAVARHTTTSLTPDGVALLVNWLGRGDDPVSGDEAADLFLAAAPSLAVTAADRRPRYRIDALSFANRGKTPFPLD